MCRWVRGCGEAQTLVTPVPPRLHSREGTEPTTQHLQLPPSCEGKCLQILNSGDSPHLGGGQEMGGT